MVSSQFYGKIYGVSQLFAVEINFSLNVQEQRLQKLKERVNVPYDESRPDHQVRNGMINCITNI
jgi:hypothetical protein